MGGATEEAVAFLGYGRDGGFGWNDSYMPSGLNVENVYFFGLNEIALQKFVDIQGGLVPDGAMEKEITVTFYPASKLPSSNIDYDIFNLIIDPSNYTASEIAHFAEQGISPAIKNADGSYTIKSQLSLAPVPLPNSV